MKLQHFTAKKVHGYIDIDIKFNEDVTFVIGLNGSGKTSALRLIMGLITPAVSELAGIEFASSSLSVSTPQGLRTITAERTSDGLKIGLSGLRETLVLENRELMRFIDSEREGRPTRRRLSHFFEGAEVLEAITQIATPMFLGLTRSHSLHSAVQPLWADAIQSAQQRELWIRTEEPATEFDEHRASVGTGLQFVQELVRWKMNEIRIQHEGLDKNLRKDILSDALRYIPFEQDKMPFRMPDRSMVARLREKERDIDSAAKRLDLPELRGSVRDFTAGLVKLIERLEPSQTKVRKGTDAGLESRLILEWMVNRTQADRVQRILEFVDRYADERNKLYESINRFVNIVNDFFAQTGKKVRVGENGALEVLTGSRKRRTAHELSSGEQQILIMLAHLALNERLAKSGVFIVDEPELSLHIAWQEMFVSAILKANPTCQVILATHSPAIILDRDTKCAILNNRTREGDLP